MSSATATTDHDAIRRRIDFREPDEGLEEISWDEWFQAFEENELAFLHDDDGESRFNKLVARNTA